MVMLGRGQWLSVVHTAGPQNPEDTFRMFERTAVLSIDSENSNAFTDQKGGVGGGGMISHT